jgi:hypothetical protein
LCAGALGSTSLQFVFPGLFHLKLFPEAPLWAKAISVFYILFGLGGTCPQLLLVSFIIMTTTITLTTFSSHPPTIDRRHPGYLPNGAADRGEVHGMSCIKS